jgi:hypothetical protein
MSSRRVSVWIIATSTPLDPAVSVGDPMSSGSMSRNSASRLIHCSNSGRRCTSTSVGRARWAISAVAITVLPAPGGAARTPVSWTAIASTAACWTLVSVPANVSEIAAPSLRSSVTVTSAPLDSISSTMSARQPRGRSRRSPASSWQAITRGVLCVDNRARSRSKKAGLANAAVRRRRSRRSGARSATAISTRPVKRTSRALVVTGASWRGRARAFVSVRSGRPKVPSTRSASAVICSACSAASR